MANGNRRGSASRVCKLGLFAAALAALFAIAQPASAQPVYADARRGHDLAATLCSTCHAVERDAAGTVGTDVLSFRAIARQPGANAVQLAGRIIIPHPAMPSVALTASEIRDIVAYIMSLKAE